MLGIHLGGGCWYGMEDEKTFPVQSVSVEQLSALDKTPNPAPPTQKTHPCEKCVLLRRDILFMVEYQGPHPGLKSHTCEACGDHFWLSPNLHQHQKCNDEKLFGTDRASSVTSCKFQVSEKPFTCREIGEDFLAMLSLLQHQATLKGARAKPHSSFKDYRGQAETITCAETLDDSGGEWQLERMWLWKEYSKLTLHINTREACHAF
ncbi:hypothetical protein MC885_017758 [Smutsia gigantea]|nr:hypothetical protein MC885_017758 [Smutsia gigantea]